MRKLYIKWTRKQLLVTKFEKLHKTFQKVRKAIKTLNIERSKGLKAVLLTIWDLHKLRSALLHNVPSSFLTMYLLDSNFSSVLFSNTINSCYFSQMVSTWYAPIFREAAGSPEMLASSYVITQNYTAQDYNLILQWETQIARKKITLYSYRRQRKTVLCTSTNNPVIITLSPIYLWSIRITEAPLP